ncbi:MAG: hypothetical protein KKF93_06335, partial [Candidatus Omnitrophica bacterium]|nr:hypothetical protein [Candidatus Omnitrophota bacterium]
QKFIERAINIIKKELSFLNTDKEISSFLEKIKNINLVIIKCLDFSELSKLFVGLNSTGIELSQVELVKGYLHGGIDQLKKSKRKIIIGKWDYLEKLFENNNIFWFNQFLRHQWYLEGGYITSSKLSNKINKEKINYIFKVFDAYFKKLNL